MRSAARVLLVIVAAAHALLTPRLAAAQAEHEVKAAFLVRFLSFVEWPESAFARPESPMVIGGIGADDVLGALQETAPGRVAHARPVTARRVNKGEPPAGVHLLFVGRSASAMLAKIGSPPGVLVVAETEGGLERGATVNFLRREGRVRFEVALDTAQKQGLRISSRMLSLAQSVRQGKL
ncbi:MAG: YfiR family protein [Betaproteobacteria bacterium]